jgi:acetyl esterase/lipase
MGLVVELLILVLILWAVARFVLAGEDLSRFDAPKPQPLTREPSAAYAASEARLLATVGSVAGTGGRRRIADVRKTFDALGDAVDLSGVEIRPIRIRALPAEWVVAPDSDRQRRLLYIHGGAFMFGSPKSHRAITTRLARAGLSVLAIDYRMAPEHRRLQTLEDCHAAWMYMLEHGPDGAAPIRQGYVAGDSAGGNLTLELIAWARDQDVHTPDAAIALSPATDSTFASPSIRTNVKSDRMLGPALAMVLRVPRTLLLWFTWFTNRVRPDDPRVSPLRGNLAGLPPLLIQASTSEVLADDAIRYANKARAAGSDVELQMWSGLMHVWQVFDPELPESHDAYARIVAHLNRSGTVVAATRRAV